MNLYFYNDLLYDGGCLGADSGAAASRLKPTASRYMPVKYLTGNKTAISTAATITNENRDANVASLKLPKLGSQQTEQNTTVNKSSTSGTKAYLIDLNQQSFENVYYNHAYRKVLSTTGNLQQQQQQQPPPMRQFLFQKNRNDRSPKISFNSNENLANVSNKPLNLNCVEGSRILFKDTNFNLTTTSNAPNSNILQRRTNPNNAQPKSIVIESIEQVDVSPTVVTDYRLKLLDKPKFMKPHNGGSVSPTCEKTSSTFRTKIVSKSIPLTSKQSANKTETTSSKESARTETTTTTTTRSVTINEDDEKPKRKSSDKQRDADADVDVGQNASIGSEFHTSTTESAIFNETNMPFSYDDYENYLNEELKYRVESPFKLNKAQPDNYKFFSNSTMNLQSQLTTSNNNNTNINVTNSRLFEANNQQFEQYQSCYYDNMNKGSNSSN